MNEQVRNRVKNRLIGSAGIIAAVVTVFFVLMFCVYKIGPGMAGIIYRVDGGIADETLGQGYHIVSPMSKVVEYPVSTETVNLDKETNGGVSISTSDGKTVACSVTYSFHMDQDRLPEVFTKFRGLPLEQIESGYMKSELLRCINEVTSQYSLMDVVGSKRQELNEKVFTRYRDSLSDFGVVVETLNISEAQPDNATAAAIQNVINSQNKLQQAQIEKQTAEQEAEKRVVEAKGKAESVRIEAEAQAAANELLERSLTDNIVKNKAIEKWDGKMPQVNGGGNMLFNIPIDR